MPVPAGAVYVGAGLPHSSLSDYSFYPEWVNQKSVTTVTDPTGRVTRVDFNADAMLSNPWAVEDSVAYLTFWIPSVPGGTSRIVLPVTAVWPDGSTATATATTELGPAVGNVSMTHTFTSDWWETTAAAHSPTVADSLRFYSQPEEAILFGADASAKSPTGGDSFFANPEFVITVPVHMELLGVTEVLLDGVDALSSVTVESSADCATYAPAVNTPVEMVKARCLRMRAPGIYKHVWLRYLARLAEPYRSALVARPGEWEFAETPYTFTADNTVGGIVNQVDHYDYPATPVISAVHRATYWNLTLVEVGADPFYAGPYQIGDLVGGPGLSVFEVPWASNRISNLHGWDNITFESTLPLELDLVGPPALNPGSPAPVDDHGNPFSPTCTWSPQDRSTSPISPASWHCTFPGHFPAVRADPYDPAVCQAAGTWWMWSSPHPFPERLNDCLSSSRSDVIANNFHFVVPTKLVGGAQGQQVNYEIKAWADSSALAKTFNIPGTSSSSPAIDPVGLNVSGRLEVALQKSAASATIVEGRQQTYSIRFANTGTAGTASTFIYDLFGYNSGTGARQATCQIPRFVSAALGQGLRAGLEYTTDSPPTRSGTWSPTLPGDPSAVTGVRFIPRSAFSAAAGTSSPLDPALIATIVLADTAGAGSKMCNSVAVEADRLQTTTANAPDTVVVALPPTLTMPASQVISATGASGAPAFFAATAFDKNGAAVPVTCSSPSGATFPLGITTVTCSATANNSTATGSFTITVVDTRPTLAALGGTFTYDGNSHPASGAGTSITGEVLPVTLEYYDSVGRQLAGPPVNAGVYSVVASYPGNGAIAAGRSAPALITINKATPMVSWTPEGLVYGTPVGAGQQNAAATLNGAPVAGSFSYPTAPGTIFGAGSQALTATFTPADSANFETVPATSTLQVARKVLAVTAGDQSRVYGAPDHFAASFSGFVNGDTSVSGTPLLSSTATASSAVGTYAISAAPGSLTSDNYSFAFASGALTVTPDATHLLLTSSASPSGFGGAVTFTAAVTAAAPGSGNPTGTVTFFDGDVLLGTGTLANDGTAVFSTSALSVGAHSIRASYGHDANFMTSESAPLAQLVNPAPTTTTVTSSANPAVFGQPLTLIATVDGLGVGSPDGLVSFYDGLHLLGEASLILGRATFDTTALEVGNHTITAAYSASGGFQGSSGTHDQTIARAPSAVQVISSQASSVFGQPVTLTATVTSKVSGAGTPTGSVTFYDGAVALGTVAVDPVTGHAALPASGLNVGAHAITASYSGDAHFLVGSAATVQTVQPAGTRTVIRPMAAALVDQPLVITADVSALSPGAGAPGGTVAFYDGATLLGSGVVGAGGTASLTATGLAVGDHQFKAVYGGDARFTASSGLLTESVLRADTATVVSSSPGPSLFGQPIKVTATVASLVQLGVAPGGSVTFYDGVPSPATKLGTATLSGGAATLNVPLLSVGAHSITATYSGDPDFNPSTAVTTQQVNPAPTSTAVSTSQASALTGQAVVFTAVVSSQVAGAGTPGGTVVFSDRGVVIGTGVLSATGQATLTTSTLSAGAHSITAAYQGSAAFVASTSAPIAQTVQPHPTAIVYSGPTLAANGQSASLSAVLTDTSSGLPLANQAVTLTMGQQACTGVTNASGVATCSIVVSQAYGPAPIVASYAGASGQYLAATASSSVLVYGFAAGGSFVIADGAAKTGSQVTFWDGQWNKRNTLSGGPAPVSFKGFVDNPEIRPGVFTTRTGNSSGPPASVPAYMAVIVASSVSQSGSVISGKSIKTVIVQTNSGYAGSPGHPGTGTVVATLSE